MRLDSRLTAIGFVPSRSQAESVIKLGDVTVDGRVVVKPGFFVSEHNIVKLSEKQRYVSRAGLKLASVADLLHISFEEKTVLDVGSSTGGFTDYALQHGARRVIAVDVGTDQLHPHLRTHEKIELHEKTDIRDFAPAEHIDIAVMDVSFISLREILPYIATIVSSDTEIVAMLKPQFEAGRSQVNKGVIKNDAVRRKILKEFEAWSKQYFKLLDKRDSDVAGAKGNQERFYLFRTVNTIR